MSRAALNKSLQTKARTGKLHADPFDILEPYLPSAEQARAGAPVARDFSSRTMSMESLLATNIVTARAFEEEVLPLATVEDVWTAVCRTVTHVEPLRLGSARAPSEAFMLLFRLGLLRPTRRQLTAALAHPNLHVRALAYLYLRYTAPPEDLWLWFAPAADDATPYKPAGEARGGAVPFGEWICGLLADRRYCGTQLPRIPTAEEREIQVQLALARKDSERAAAAVRAGVPARLTAGTAVRARFSEDSQWYAATIDGPAGERDAVAPTNKWWVTYTEFGNSELRSLGQIELVEGRSAGIVGGGTGSGAGRAEREWVGWGDAPRPVDAAPAPDHTFAHTSAPRASDEDEVRAIRAGLAAKSQAAAVAHGRDYVARGAVFSEAVRSSDYNVSRLDARVRDGDSYHRSGSGGGGGSGSYFGRGNDDRAPRQRSPERDARRDLGREHERDRGRDGRPKERSRSRSRSRERERFVANGAAATMSTKPPVPDASASSFAPSASAAPPPPPVDPAVLARQREILARYGDPAPRGSGNSGVSSSFGAQDRDGEDVVRFAGGWR